MDGTPVGNLTIDVGLNDLWMLLSELNQFIGTHAHISDVNRISGTLVGNSNYRGGTQWLVYGTKLFRSIYRDSCSYF